MGLLLCLDRSRRVRRLNAGMLLALYALLAVGAPLAHAIASMEQPVLVHVESRSDTPCPPAHDGLHCQTCQTARLAAPPAQATPDPADAPCLRTPAVPLALALASAAPAGPHGPRAPPTT